MGCGPYNGRCVRPTEWPLLDPLPPEARRRVNEFRRLFGGRFEHRHRAVPVQVGEGGAAQHYHAGRVGEVGVVV